VRALYLLIFCTVYLLGINVHAGEVVRLAIGEWAPYTSESDPTGKLLERIVTEAFRLEGVEVQYSYFPWKRSYLRVEDGSFDGTFPWNRTQERDKAFILNRVPLVADQAVYFHLKSTAFDWNTLADLKKYRVGVTLGYKNEGIYKKNNIQADVAPSEELNFKKLALGRIEVYETSKVVGYATIAKTMPPELAAQFTHHPKPVAENDYFILFSRRISNGQALAEKFDSGLRKLKASGAYTKVFTP
jgi:polar amino acid transport system substrate-binding protein